MAKTQMQLANRAWRTETKALGWHQGQSWKGGRKRGKRFVVKMQPQPFMSAKTAMSQIL